MEYDEIDQYVDQLFRDSEDRPANEPLNGEVLSGDWRIDRIDKIIQDTYDDAIWWHNQRISEGTDPRSGLRSLPYIPWDEQIDGAAAMMGASAGVGESSFQRNGGHWSQYAVQSGSAVRARRSGLSCAEMALIGAVVVGLLIFMMVAS